MSRHKTPSSTILMINVSIRLLEGKKMQLISKDHGLDSVKIQTEYFCQNLLASNYMMTTRNEKYQLDWI